MTEEQFEKMYAVEVAKLAMLQGIFVAVQGMAMLQGVKGVGFNWKAVGELIRNGPASIEPLKSA